MPLPIGLRKHNCIIPRIHKKVKHFFRFVKKKGNKIPFLVLSSKQEICTVIDSSDMIQCNPVAIVG